MNSDLEEIKDRIEKLEEENEELREKMKNISADDAKKTLENVLLSRRQFMKMLGAGAGGLALSSSVTGISWSILQPGSQGTSDVKAETANKGASPFTLTGNLEAVDGEVLWNESSSYIPTSNLENDSLTITAGTDLTGGGTVALGGSTTIGFAGSTGVPSGTIVLWSVSISNIPTAWVLCDGNNGTPNLQDRFVVGAGSSYSVGNTGGASTVTLTSSEMPSHSHGGSTSTDGSHSHDMPGYYSNDTGGNYGPNPSNDSGKINWSSNSAGSHSHNLNINSTGGGSAHENKPPYYSLAYIMKT